MKSLQASKKMKKTKAGMIPVDWEVARLDEIAELKSGGTPSKSNLSFWGGDFPWVSAKDLKQSIVFDSIDHLSDSGVKSAKKDSLLILVRGMTLYKDVPVCLVGRNIVFNQDIKAIVLQKRIFPSYLQFYMLSRKKMLLKLVDSAGHGTGRLDTTLLKNFPIVFPSYNEQKAIADLLTTWDEAIAKTERLIQVKEKRFKWLLNVLINNNQNKYKWHDVTFSEIFTSSKKKNTSNSIYEILSVTKEGIVLQSEYFKKEVASNNKKDYLIVDRNDFVMSGLNFWMGSVDFQTIVDVGIVSPAYKVFKVRSDKTCIDFLRFFVRTKKMTNLLISVSVQGASIVRRNLDKEMLKNAVINVPSLKEQKEIARTLYNAQHETDLLKSLVEKYKTQKRGLMQKMLTGEWRVREGTSLKS